MPVFITNAGAAPLSVRLQSAFCQQGQETFCFFQARHKLQGCARVLYPSQRLFDKVVYITCHN
jgi:hypothetical protein